MTSYLPINLEKMVGPLSKSLALF